MTYSTGAPNAFMDPSESLDKAGVKIFAQGTLNFTPGIDLPHDDVIKWKHFPRYWPFVRRIHRPR